MTVVQRLYTSSAAVIGIALEKAPTVLNSTVAGLKPTVAGLK